MTPRFPFPARLLQTCLSALALSSMHATAQNIDRLYPGDQFDALMYQPRQSTGDPAYESILKDLRDANFEPLALYDKDDPVRKLAEPVGLLKVLLKSNEYLTCTASVIDKDLILTNWHCLPKYGGQVAKAALWMGFYNDDDQGVVRYEVNTRPVESDKDLDYAILRVTGDVAGAWGRVRLSPEDPPGNRSLSLVHHPAGRPKQLTQRSCRTAAPPMVQDRLRHKCDTLPGSSGAPVFFGSGPDAPMVALHFAGVPQSLQGVDPTLEANRAAPVSRLVAKSSILKRLVAAPAPVPKPTPVASVPASTPQPASANTDRARFQQRQDFVGVSQLLELAKQGYAFCGDYQASDNSCRKISKLRDLGGGKIEFSEMERGNLYGSILTTSVSGQVEIEGEFWCLTNPNGFDMAIFPPVPGAEEAIAQQKSMATTLLRSYGGKECVGAYGSLRSGYRTKSFNAYGEETPVLDPAAANTVTTPVKGVQNIRVQPVF